MDKEKELLSAAHSIFAEKGYKDTGISDITQSLNIATGSFYKYYLSKEDIFLQVYQAENTRIRKLIMAEVDWQGPIEQVVEDLFAASGKYLFGNKIMAEWTNPKIANILHDYYLSDQGKKDNQFHQFLTSILDEKIKELDLEGHLTGQLKRVYEFLYYLDCHITDRDFKGYNQVIQLLIRYFIKGVLYEKEQKSKQ